MDWQSLWRDFQEQPLFYPLLVTWEKFMSIKRYDKFPFYIYPGAKSVSSYEDKFLNFVDFLVDAHELERNKQDSNRSFYQRSGYVYENLLRYTNETVANMMFEVKARKSDLNRIQSVQSIAHVKYFGAMTLMHTSYFMWLCYFFRYKNLKLTPTLIIGAGYYLYFNRVNKIGYKLIVDKAVIDEARRLGYDRQVQPVGSYRPRQVNFN